MIDFPASPVVGQTFSGGTGLLYMWDGVAWNVTSNLLLTAQSRNLIVNPVMAITQENGTTAGTANAYYVADQWRINFVAAGAAISANVSYTNINPSGGPGRILYKTTTAKASLAAGDYAAFYTVLEGSRVYPLFYSGNTPLQAVLRFGFNGPAGTYSVAIRNLTAYTVCWTGQFTISAAQANTDTYQTLVIPSPPTGYVWAGGSSGQIEIWFTFACSGASLVAPANGWQAGSFISGPGQFNLLGTVNNQAQIWDVGLYADPQKTGLPPPFQVPDYGLDLFECQRYYHTLDMFLINASYGNASGQMLCSIPYAPAMRAVPTVTYLSPSYSNSSNIRNNAVGAWNLRAEATQTAAGAAWANATVVMNARP